MLKYPGAQVSVLSPNPKRFLGFRISDPGPSMVMRTPHINLGDGAQQLRPCLHSDEFRAVHVFDVSHLHKKRDIAHCTDHTIETP